MRFLYYSVFIITFVVASAAVIYYASGYNFDFKTGKFSQKSLLSIQTDNADIYLNEKRIGSGKVLIRSIESGDYQIEVKKQGYKTWKKEIFLNPGSAQLINDVVLFLEKNELIKDSSTDVEEINKLSDRDGLYFNDGELYQNNTFITRFSSDINGICWYPDGKHIAYTLNNKLIISDIDGQNPQEILEKNSTSPVIFVNSGKTVIYENNGSVYRSRIR